MTENTFDTVDLIDSGIAEEAFEQDPVLAEYQNAAEQQHWQDELVAARKERERFNDAGMKTIKRYADEREGDQNPTSSFNIFYANTEIKMSSLFARLPVPDFKRRFNDPTDQVSRVAANILQRVTTYELECEGFEPKFKQMLFDRLVPGVGIGWARLDETYGEPEYEDVKHPITGQPIMDPASGMTLQQPISNSELKHQLADIDYVAWNDFVWSPCRVWSLCRWVGRRVPMSKAAIKSRFDDKVDQKILANLAFSLPSLSTPTKDKDAMRPKHSTQATVDVYELWDKERGLIFWITEGCDVPLDVQKDTNEFPDFFPTPLPPMCRNTTSNTTPISDFSLVQDLYNELDALNNRCSKMVRALRVAFVYDSSNTALRDLFTSATELEGVPVKDWAVLVAEKGGLKGSMEFAPIQELVGAYAGLIQARDAVKNQIMEIEGINDFLRGIQQPYVTASAAQSTNSASASRLTVMQQEVAKYIESLLRLKAHLICKFYTPQIILSIVGQLPLADRQFIQPALALLANEQMRHFRLEVSVDSIQQANWNQDKADRTELLHGISAFLQQMLPAAQQNPALMPFGISMLQFAVSGYKGAKDLEGTLSAGLQQLTAAAAQHAQQPPPPSPEMIKAQGVQAQIQSNEQIAADKTASAERIASLNAELKDRDLQIKALQAQTKAKQVDASIEHDKAKFVANAMDTIHSHAVDRAELGALS